VSWVILGGGGLLAGHLRRALGDLPVRALPHAACDVTRPDAVAAAVRGATVVINCAGFTAVDRAESEPDAARRVNVDGAAHVAHAAARAGALLVHLSTDFVFDGRAAPYRTDAAPHPLSTYGRTKRAGELAALAAGGRVLLVRVQALYAADGHTFASRIAAMLQSNANGVRIDDSRLIQPTWAPIAAHQIATLARTGSAGAFHLGCAGGTTWAGFGRALAARLGVPPTFTAVPTAALAALARRPADCRFDHAALLAAGVAVPSWEEGLDGYVASLGGGAAR
jgi:dTDP-4-dehydrorhamnose reductase